MSKEPSTGEALAMAIAALVGILVGVFAFASVTADHFTAKRYSADLDWPVFLDVLEQVEAPKDAMAATTAIMREGAYGPLQIRQACLTDVNIRYGTDIKLEEVAKSRGLSRWVCVQYIRHYCKPLMYQGAARTWNGGPQWPSREATYQYWDRVRGILLNRGVDP